MALSAYKTGRSLDQSGLKIPPHEKSTPFDPNNSQSSPDNSDLERSSSPNEELCDDEPEFPEGGLQAWLVVFGAFCGMGAVFGLINTTGVFESYLHENQLKGYSHSQIGWVFSLYMFIVCFVGIQVGPVFDRYGPRIPIAAGSVLIVASLMLMSISTTFYQIILTYSVLGGLGGALMNSPAYGSIAHFFNERRAFATGIAMMAGGVCGIVFPILLQYLLSEKGVGFGWSCRIMGFILLGLCVPANLFLRSRLPPKRDAEGKVKVDSVWPDLSILRDKPFAMAALGVFFMDWGLFVPITYIVSYAAAHGNGDADSSLFLSLLNAGSVLGRFLPGLLADKLGRFNIIITTIALCTTLTLAVWLPAGDSKPALLAYCVTFGFASGSNLSLMPVCVGQFCDHRDYGRYCSTANMISSFATLSSPPIAGALLEAGKSFGWSALILFSGLSYALAFLCYAAARVMAAGWDFRKKF